MPQILLTALCYVFDAFTFFSQCFFLLFPTFFQIKLDLALKESLEKKTSTY